MARDLEDEEEDLVDDLAAVSPLAALDPDEVDRLSPSQRKFILAFINTGSIAAGRKAADIKQRTWLQWQSEERFAKVLAQVKSPVVFAGKLAQAIVWRAALRHYELLNHERVSVQQWAIDRAYNIMAAQQSGQKGSTDVPVLSQAEVKQLAERVAGQLDEIDRRRLERNPFEFVEGEAVTVPAEEEVVNDVPVEV